MVKLCFPFWSVWEGLKSLTFRVTAVKVDHVSVSSACLMLGAPSDLVGIR